MDENDLMTALEERAHDVPVGAAPIDTMTRQATRTRRRTTVLGGIAAAAVAAVAAVGIAQALPDDSTSDSGTDPAVQRGASDVPPDGFTYVGIGSAAIAVPDDWPRNAIECNSVPSRTTYVVDVYGGVSCLMATPFPDDADAIEVKPLDQVTTTGWTPVEIEGVEGLRSPTESAGSAGSAGSGPTEMTSGSVAVPSEGVVFTVTSTVDPDNVESLLDGVVILDDHTGVPGFFDLQPLDPGDPRQQDAYLDRLEAAGLVPELVDQTDRRYYEPGTVISVDPLPGTVVGAGSTVRVTVSAS